MFFQNHKANMLKEMLAAIDKLHDLANPAAEYRLHPDDYDALCAETHWMSPPARFSSLGGLRIVLDPGSPRLPGKRI